MCEKEKDKGKSFSVSENGNGALEEGNKKTIIAAMIDHILNIPEYARIVYVCSLMFNVSAVAVAVFFLIHGFYSIPGARYLVEDRKPRKKAQGLCMYIGMRAYSIGLRFIPWINVQALYNKNQLPKCIAENSKFILTSNHVSFMDMFVICRMSVTCLPKEVCETLRVIYWSELSKAPVLGWVFYLTGSIPIKMVGGRSVEVPNEYDKNSVKEMYANVQKAIEEDGLNIAMSFEGRRNMDPKKLSKIQKGMLKISDSYDVPVILYRLRDIERIWPADGLPGGMGTIRIDLYPDQIEFKGKSIDQYEETQNSIVSFGLDKRVNNWGFKASTYWKRAQDMYLLKRNDWLRRDILLEKARLEMMEQKNNTRVQAYRGWLFGM